MKEQKNIAIFFGGYSPEYGVSLESAYAVIRNLNQKYYKPIPIGISRTGKWFYFSGEIEKIKEDTWYQEAECIPALLSPNRGERKLWLQQGDEWSFISIDVAFPVLHGKNGEDGTIQGLLELTGIPVVGCGTLASALCMDKERAHKLAQAAGVRVPKSLVLNQIEWETRSSCQEKRFGQKESLEQKEISVPKENFVLKRIRDFGANVGYPLYVKPVKAGSSYGVTKVLQPDKLKEAITQAFVYDNQVILEEEIDGFEVGCAILGNENLLVGEVDEIELQDGFFDFTEKYTLRTSAIHVPARISKEKVEEVKETAKQIYRALGCSGFARVDLFLTSTGELVFNEVNTIPGFTEHSRYPGMMKAAGYSFTEILEKLIALAIDTGKKVTDKCLLE